MLLEQKHYPELKVREGQATDRETPRTMRRGPEEHAHPLWEAEAKDQEFFRVVTLVPASCNTCY